MSEPAGGHFGPETDPGEGATAESRQIAESFRLSRIQAEGWSAARKYLASGASGDEKAIAALNPHRTTAERARWYLGFNSAIDRI